MLRFALVVFLVISAMVVFARAEDHHHPPQDAQLHDRFYSTWNRPDQRGSAGERKVSCCNKKDCAPATAVKRIGGRWWALRGSDAQWVLIPENIIEQNQPDPRESPDESSHLCSMGGQVFCFVLGSGL